MTTYTINATNNSSTLVEDFLLCTTKQDRETLASCLMHVANGSRYDAVVISLSDDRRYSVVKAEDRISLNTGRGLVCSLDVENVQRACALIHFLDQALEKGNTDKVCKLRNKLTYLVDKYLEVVE